MIDCINQKEDVHIKRDTIDQETSLLKNFVCTCVTPVQNLNTQNISHSKIFYTKNYSYVASQFVILLAHVSWLYQMALLQYLKPYSKDIQSTGFHFVCCHVNCYTCEHNMEKLQVIKFSGLKIFLVSKLKIIEHFAHTTLITTKYS